MDNANTNDYLEKIKVQVIENLKKTAFAPSVQMQDVPRDPLDPRMTEEEEAELDDLDADENKDVRHTKRRWDQHVTRDDELDESEDEDEAARHGVRPQNGAMKRRNIMDYQNDNATSDTEMSGVVTPLETVDPATTAAATEANAEVNAEVMKNKQLSVLVQEDIPSNAASRAESPRPVDTEGDIDMTGEPAAVAPLEEAVPAPAVVAAMSPPQSPPAAAPVPAPASPPAQEPTAETIEDKEPKQPEEIETARPVEATESVETTEIKPEVVEQEIAKEEGEAKRSKEDITAEASKVIAEESQP